MTVTLAHTEAATSQRLQRQIAAFTLVELLIASAIALVVIGALASLFTLFSRAASDSQAVVAMTSQMRSAAGRLRQDLTGLTVPLRPPLNPETGAGYFELLEGPNTDLLRVSASGTTVQIRGTDSILGDVDDVLLFTTRSTGEPFTGKYSTGQIASPLAEVAWFCRPAAVQPVPGLMLQNLYRRQLLIIGHVGVTPFFTGTLGATNQVTGTIPTIYNTYDLSLREDRTFSSPFPLVPNTLADLMRRENRFIPSMRTSGTSPFVPILATGSSAPGLVFDAVSGREGEDVILGNVIGFDVRVYDPDAQPRAAGPWAIYPNEQEYTGLSATGTLSFTGIPPARGAFIDLGCLPMSGLTILTGSGSGKSGLSKSAVTGTATYDTWSTHFESNGIDEDDFVDGNAGVDQGTNGRDDTSTPTLPTLISGIAGLPDEAAEAEVPPPYRRNIPAIEIRIRCFDPTSRQIRQTTVRQQFTN